MAHAAVATRISYATHLYQFAQLEGGYVPNSTTQLAPRNRLMPLAIHAASHQDVRLRHGSLSLRSR